MSSRYVQGIAMVMAASVTLALLSISTTGAAWGWAWLRSLSKGESHVMQIALPLLTALLLAAGAVLRMRRSCRHSFRAG